MRSSLSRPGRAVSAILVAGVLSLAGVTVSAQPGPASPRLPTGREVIDRYVKAIGGRAAILAHTSLHAVGSYAVPSSGMTGTFERFQATRPDRTLDKIVVAGVGEILTGFDGQHGWTVNPMVGPMLQQGKELEQARLDAQFYGDLHEGKDYKNVTTLEKTVFEGHPCYKVSVARSDGTDDIEYYDVDTGLRDGSVNTRESPMGPVTATTIYTGYKKFGSLLEPTDITVKAMGVEQHLTFTSIEYDNVPASAFEPPTAVKALIK